jgi:hypothetical protein
MNGGEKVLGQNPDFEDGRIISMSLNAGKSTSSILGLALVIRISISVDKC